MHRHSTLSTLRLLLLAVLSLLAPGCFAGETQCDPEDGLQVSAQADARTPGYLITPSRTGSSYFRHAVYDLVQGRIRYFEMEEAEGRYGRYRLEDTHSPECIPRRRFDAELSGLTMPAGRCVAMAVVPASDSPFTVHGYPPESGQLPARIAVSNRQTGEVLAEYRRPQLGWLRGASACLREADTTPSHPAWNLSSFVFPDDRGEVFGLDDFRRMAIEESLGTGKAGLLPPLAWTRLRLLQDGVALRPECHLPGWTGKTEVHVVELERGPLDITARLDAENEKSGFVILDVYAPDRSVIIMARAHGPTVWHMHEASNSTVVAMLVRGHHGQAVVGLTEYSKILMSTDLHNPFTNCTAQELQAIEQRVIAQYGITRTQRQNPQASPPVVRYGIGDEMPDGGEIFHDEHPLEDFEIRRPEVVVRPLSK